MSKVAVLVAVLAVSMAPSASGQTLSRDYVSGTVSIDSTLTGPTQLTFGASSAPAGGDPTGVVSAALLNFGVFLDFQVTCISVNGNAATVGARYFARPLGEQLLYFQIVDGGPGNPDQLGSPAGGSAFDCAKPPVPFLATNPIISGDLVVHDALPLPTSKQECKNGGWRTYGTFKNQGDCVSFVATGGRNPPARKPS